MYYVAGRDIEKSHIILTSREAYRNILEMAWDVIIFYVWVAIVIM